MTERKIYFVRHAESLHNEYVEEYKKQNPHVEEHEIPDPFLFDCELSEFGKVQAEEMSVLHMERPEVIFCSPLKRAVRTMMIGLSDWMPGVEIPVVIYPLASEMVDNACDVGTPLQRLRESFDEFDYENFSEDIWWYHPEDHDLDEDNYMELWMNGSAFKEPVDVLQKRISLFKEWIKSRSETRIAVVGHSSYIKSMLGMSRKLKNCEVKEVLLDHNGNYIIENE